MNKITETLLSKITMYKLVLYSLILILLYSVVLGYFNILKISPISIIFSTFFTVTLCLAFNKLFELVYKSPVNSESVFITALILALVISPIENGSNEFFLTSFFVSMLAISSKYILAINRKHVFNPVAIALVLSGVFLNLSGSWWVATFWMLPPVLLTGFFIVKKTQRFDLFFSFLLSFLVISLFLHMFNGSDKSFLEEFFNNLTKAPILFFAFFMLTEPLTMPPKSWHRITYGALTGLLFSPLIHISSLYFTPELALVAGNIFTYIISPKQKLFLVANSIKKLATDTYEFSFKKDGSLIFLPGQYMEFTIKDNLSDSRGNRRYFTLASSPTEDDVKLGVKYYKDSSTYKVDLLKINKNDTIIASQLSGDFVMPKDKNRKLVFIAGGIGITPFRSMIKYLLDIGEKRDITLFYSNRKVEDIAYFDMLSEAEQKLGLKVVYAITDPDPLNSLSGCVNGFIDKNIILQNVTDCKNNLYYISGPHSMVSTFENSLRELGVPSKNIKVDFFPGLA